MTIIKYMQLVKAIVRETGMHPSVIYDTIVKVRQLPDDLKAVVAAVLDGNIPNAEYRGVCLQDIIDKDHFAPLRAVLMLDWIRREPAVAMRYMETEQYHAPQIVTDADHDMLDAVLTKLQTSRKAEGGECDESDIVF